jgi:hypothetical protein
MLKTLAIELSSLLSRKSSPANEIPMKYLQMIHHMPQPREANMISQIILSGFPDGAECKR